MEALLPRHLDSLAVKWVESSQRAFSGLEKGGLSRRIIEQPFHGSQIVFKIVGGSF